MKTWRDVKWKYVVGHVYARVDGKSVLICVVPDSLGPNRSLVGRAIVHAWNVDLAAAQSWRELYGIDDSVKTRED